MLGYPVKLEKSFGPVPGGLHEGVADDARAISSKNNDAEIRVPNPWRDRKISRNRFDTLVEVNFLNVAGREYVIHVNQAHE